MRPKKRNWTPYILLLPSLVYLAVFFAFPMGRSLSLAFWKDDASLALHEGADQNSATIGTIPQAATIAILATRGNLLEGEIPQGSQTEVWFRISTTDPENQPVEGWVLEDRVRVDETDEATGAPILGRIRTVRRSGSDPQTSVYTEPGAAQGEVVTSLDPQTEVSILEQSTLEVWYQIRGENSNGETLEGWAQSSYIVPGQSDPTTGFVQRGNTGELTLDYIRTMVSDRFFTSALTTTLLLTIITIPIQFVFALVMALVIQSRLKGNSMFLYIFAIPLGVSELAVGIVFFLLFTERGYINSFLQSIGLIDQAHTL